MKGWYDVNGRIIKEYLSVSFGGTTTKNYIMILSDMSKCIIYTKASSRRLPIGEDISLRGYFGKFDHYKDIVWCRRVELLT